MKILELCQGLPELISGMCFRQIVVGKTRFVYLLNQVDISEDIPVYNFRLAVESSPKSSVTVKTQRNQVRERYE